MTGRRRTLSPRGRGSISGRYEGRKRRRPSAAWVGGSPPSRAWACPTVRSVGTRDRLAASLRARVRPGDLCLAPWWHDGHPDHDACGRAALGVTESVGAQFLGYLVWAWHWADPRGTDLPWADCRRFDFDRRTAARKRWATGAFVSQTRPLGPDREGVPLLPAAVLRRFWRPYEVFVLPPGREW